MPRPEPCGWDPLLRKLLFPVTFYNFPCRPGLLIEPCYHLFYCLLKGKAQLLADFYYYLQRLFASFFNPLLDSVINQHFS